MEIKDIKSRLTLANVLHHYGLKPDKSQRLNCPFHEDKTPSLQVYYKTHTAYCFSANCQTHGKSLDVIDFIYYMERSRNESGMTTKHEAIKKAQELISGTTIPTTQELTRTAILTKMFTYFKNAVHNSKPARDYLQSRGLDLVLLASGGSPVGYNSGQFHHAGRSKATASSDRNVSGGRDESFIKSCVNVGLLSPFGTNSRKPEEQAYKVFGKECICFALKNRANQITGLYFRSSISDAGNNKHFYLKDSSGLYPNYPKAETEKLIITESIIDAASLLQLESITKEYTLLAAYGTNRLTAEHINAIKELKYLKEIIFAFDNDQAGNKAIEKYSAQLRELMPGVALSQINLPEGEDVNSTAQTHEPELFLHLLENRIFLSRPSVRDVPFSSENISTEKEKSLNSRLPTSDSRLDTSNPEALVFEHEWLTATMWGGIDLYNIRKLRVTLHVQSKTNQYQEYRDTVDLYSHSQTSKLIREAGEKLEISSTELSRIMASLTRSLEQYRQSEREKQQQREEAEKRKNLETFTAEELRAGEAFLKDKKLMEQTELHIKNIGLVGEEEKGMLLFFILLTRMFKEPLHALVQGRSGSGKTYLLKKIASLVPKAHIRITTALTENTLYHSLQDFWKHMILLIEDLDGVFNALLPLREMMSNQSISKLSTEKNLKTGEFEQKILYVEGPVCVAGATTKDSIYEDNANRSFLIQVNESPEHQESVLDYQRKNIAGLMDKSRQEQTQTLLKTAQLQLEPLEVVIPFGEELRIPDYVFKKLRTNAHYLILIKSIAFWHQKQREQKQKADGTKYIEAKLEDVFWANKLSKEILLRKSDELNGALRGFFECIKSYLQSTNTESFYAKPIREKLRMNPMQVNRYLKELDQRGYIKYIGGTFKTGYEYKVMVWNDYETLQNGLNILDQTLEKLKAKQQNK